MEWIPFCKQRIIDLVYNIKSSNLLRARLKEHPGVVNTRLLATGVGPGTGQDKMEHETSRASGYLCIGSEAGTLKWITNSSWDSLGGGGGAEDIDNILALLLATGEVVPRVVPAAVVVVPGGLNCYPCGEGR